MVVATNTYKYLLKKILSIRMNLSELRTVQA